MKNILVVGSINMDLVIKTDRMPELGETLTGSGFATNPGGKGANQAVAASRLGAEVRMIGAVGSDTYGETMKKVLTENGVSCDGVRSMDTTTGIAVITVCRGDNCILLDKGANERVTPEYVGGYEELFIWADFVIFQLEIPQESILAAARLAKKHGANVVLNPAPAQPLDSELLSLTDILVPNEHEAALILDTVIRTPQQEEDAVRKLLDLGIEHAVITLGSRGCIFNDETGIRRQAAYHVDAVDTTAAGDSFIAALCVGLSHGLPFSGSVSYASAVSALAVTKEGAIPSLPFASEVREFMDKMR